MAIKRPGIHVDFDADGPPTGRRRSTPHGGGGGVVPDGPGIAARYPGDNGIAADPAVILADDFESWGGDGTTPPAGLRWMVHSDPESKTQVVTAETPRPEYGRAVLRVSCWKGARDSRAGGLDLKLGNYNTIKEGLGPGYDELFVRYYIRLADDYVNTGTHGSNLGGRDPSRNSWWVGQSGMYDVGQVNYFYCGLQPFPDGKANDRAVTRWQYGFYSYNLDKPDAFGEDFRQPMPVFVRAGEWHCLERHLRLNSVAPLDPNAPVPTPPAVPAADATAAQRAAYRAALAAYRDALNVGAAFDGIEELWVDGELAISVPIRYRRNPDLHINFFSLGAWYGSLLPLTYTQDAPISVFYDNVVIAKEYIGPIRTPRAGGS